MEHMLKTGVVDAVAVSDPFDGAVADAQALAPDAVRVADLDALLAQDLDGLVIATPSVVHAEQTIQALKRGVAVFCQKPLGRNRAETEAAIEAARTADRLLGVDLSYRFTNGVQRIRELLQAGDLGHVHAIDLTFHNAYGPDKPWFYDPALSGGGCVMDLGVHLVDLALWLLGSPKVVEVSSHLFAQGRPLASRETAEDYAVATLVLEGGTVVRLACSWKLPAGQDAVISAAFYGTGGGAEMRNVGGSFYDFTTERFRGTSREVLASPPEEWGGRAAADWARRLAAGERFDPSIDSLIEVADALDRIYRIGPPASSG